LDKSASVSIQFEEKYCRFFWFGYDCTAKSPVNFILRIPCGQDYKCYVTNALHMLCLV